MSREPVQETTLHGHRVAYSDGGRRPGGRCSSTASPRARTRGRRDAGARRALHGRRARPARPRRARPSRAATTRWAPTPAACATCSAALGHERATVVGHSLGGGIAMQFAYQFPERSSAWCWSPAAAWAARSTCCCAPRRCPARSGCCRCSRAAPLRATRRRPSAPCSAGSACAPATDVAEIGAGLRVARATRGARRAFIHTARSIIDPGGQRVSATDRLYLAERRARR